jgi:hypothetical protein
MLPSTTLERVYELELVKGWSFEFVAQADQMLLPRCTVDTGRWRSPPCRPERCWLALGVRACSSLDETSQP